MNLNQLRFASAVAATGSFTAAATACCVTQPTLSNAIAQLEQELGERLFARTTRKVAPTPFGAHLLPYLAQVLAAQATLVQQAQAYLRPDTRLIRIGTSPLVNSQLLALMLEPFRSQHPDVEVVLREMNMTQLYGMLDAGLLDVVFGVANGQKGRWTSTFLYAEALLFLPRGAHWPNGARVHAVAFNEICAETFVMVPDACGLARATHALFRSHRRKLHAYSGQAMSYQVLAEWAALGIGAAILPKSKLAAGAQSAYAITDRRGADVMLGFEASWLRTSEQAEHLHAFAHHLRVLVPSIMAGLDLGAPA